MPDRGYALRHREVTGRSSDRQCFQVHPPEQEQTAGFICSMDNADQWQVQAREGKMKKTRKRTEGAAFFALNNGSGKKQDSETIAAGQWRLYRRLHAESGGETSDSTRSPLTA
ncbi:unnamed protein product [Pleuronectes platessa]|uniref:Uncharacterized protein n=1 Tax=Pleuronectes platessa TaxID=8262 RepID=A0A9N7UX09_PLEPL|nr:unnamed protein product [Pleuronectes platessa]